MKIEVTDQDKINIEQLIKNNWPHEYIIVWRDKPTIDSYGVVKLIGPEQACAFELTYLTTEQQIKTVIEGQKLSKSVVANELD